MLANVLAKRVGDRANQATRGLTLRALLCVPRRGSSPVIWSVVFGAAVCRFII